MPENDFEKQVQQLFNELRLKPSAEVWPKVSSRIRKEKGRKKAFIWIPLALLLLGAGGYLLMQLNGSGAARDGFTKSTITTSPAAGSETLDAGSDTGGSGSDSRASNGPQHSVKPPVNIQASGNIQHQATPAVPLPVPDRSGKPTAVAEGKRSPVYPVHGNTNTEKETAFTGTEEIGHPGNTVPVTPLLSAVQQSVDATSAWSLPGIEAGKILHDVPGNTGTPVKLAKKKVWEWGISGGAGVVSVSEGLSGLLGGNSTQKSNLNAMPNTPNTTNNIGFLTGQSSLVAALPPPASPVKRRLAWQAGGFVKWKMTSRLAVTGGLQYSYYSTGRVVGNDINNYRLTLNNTLNDANASYAGYYPGGQSIYYVNRYHFVEIPAGLQWQFNKSVALPLQLNGGLSLSWLANTTAVHYHTQTGSYYKDRALFNTVQAGAYAGASATLFANSRRPLYIGPVVQYNLTHLLKPAAVNSDQHFIYTGLKAEWVLGKK